MSRNVEIPDSAEIPAPVKIQRYFAFSSVCINSLVIIVIRLNKIKTKYKLKLVYELKSNVKNQI